MSDVELGTFFGLFTDLRFTLNAETYLSQQTADNLPPYFLPSNYGSTPDTFPSPGPGIVRALPQHLYPLEGINPNGAWRLYLYNSRLNAVSGELEQGWQLRLRADNTARCPRPYALTVDEMSITSSSATIQWTDYGHGPYDIFYTLAGESPPSADTPPSLAGIVDTFATLSGLTANLHYRAYVRSSCGNGRSGWVGPVEFRLLPDCSRFTPMNLCTTYGPAESTTVLGWQMDGCTNGNTQYYFSFTPTQTAAYVLENLAGDINEASFFAALRTDDGQCVDQAWSCQFADEYGAIPLGVLQANTSYRILFETEGTDFALRPSLCGGTLALEPQILEGPYSIRPQLVDGFDGAEGTFDFYYTPAGSLPPDEQTPPGATIVDIDPRATLTGLDPDTDYELYVRRHCEAGNSCWSPPFPFRTEADCGDLSYLGQTATTATQTTLRFLVNSSVTNWGYDYGLAPYPQGSSGLTQGISITGDTLNLTIDNLTANQNYELYYYPYCSSNGLDPLFGPIAFSTNSDCLSQSQPITCGEEVENRFTLDDSLPLSLDQPCHTQQLQAGRLFYFVAGTSGTATLTRTLVGGSSDALASFHLSPVSAGCRATDFTYLGCWDLGATDFPSLRFPVEAGQGYFLYCQVAQISGPAAFAQFNFQLEDCGLVEDCPQITSITATYFNDATGIRLTWAGTGAECYDLLYAPLNDPLDPNTDPPTLTCWGPELHVIPIDEPGTAYQYFVRARCGDTVTDWVGGQYPEEGMLLSVESNEFTFCAPLGLSGPLAGLSYNYQKFTPAAAGNYRWELEGVSGISQHLQLYQDTIIPANLLASSSGNGRSPLPLEAMLTAATDYVIVVAQTTNLNPLPYTLLSLGPVAFAERSPLQGATAASATGLVPPTDGLTNANYNCLGAEGWRHYYADRGTARDRTDDYLIFSIQDYPALATAAPLVGVGGTRGASLLTNPPAEYLRNESGIALMNRYWQVILDPADQPESPIPVRFYWHNQDWDELSDLILTQSWELPANYEALFFYKINGSYDVDPVNGHAGVPIAAEPAADGYWEYYHGDADASRRYTLSYHHDGNPYVEYLVSRFSGGGGGAAAAGQGALTVRATYTTAPANYWLVFPNPARERLRLQELHGKTEGQLRTLAGHLLWQGEMSVTGLDLSTLPAGIYLLELRDANYQGHFRIVVQ
jgi:hypothetical protein